MSIAGLFAVNFLNCTSDKVTGTTTEELELIYDGTGKAEMTRAGADYSLVDYIYKADPSGKVAGSFLVALENEGIGQHMLDVDKIYLFKVTNADVDLISVPYPDNGRRIAAYVLEGVYCFIETIQDGGTVYAYTLDGNEFFTGQYDSETGTLELDTNGSNPVINDFSDMVYGMLHPTTRAVTRAECCRKESSFNGCVSCTKDALGLTGSLSFLFDLVLPEIDLIIRASCIGAGPNASC